MAQNSKRDEAEDLTKHSVGHSIGVQYVFGY